MNDHETGTNNEDIERLAAELHENVRALNHLTQGPPSLAGPAVAYSVLGSLAQTSFRLVQTVEQIDTFLTRELDAGRLGQDQGDDPARAVTTVHNALGQATEQAAELSDSFHRAASALAPVHGVDVGGEPSVELRDRANQSDREAAQVEPAEKDFPNSIGDVLPNSSATDPRPSETRSPPPQVPHPRRER
ncbi:hypothetical protein GCM10022254_52550 [Actinomadura meridiana]|uniref:Uncharacterized protein n=1 Tax=Actinomadura meridiana TaxID=559626 RepID=A0ABP8CDY3_9ACTN